MPNPPLEIQSADYRPAGVYLSANGHQAHAVTRREWLRHGVCMLLNSADRPDPYFAENFRATFPGDEEHPPREGIPGGTTDPRVACLVRRFYESLECDDEPLSGPAAVPQEQDAEQENARTPWLLG